MGRRSRSGHRVQRAVHRRGPGAQRRQGCRDRVQRQGEVGRSGQQVGDDRVDRYHRRKEDLRSGDRVSEGGLTGGDQHRHPRDGLGAPGKLRRGPREGPRIRNAGDLDSALKADAPASLDEKAAAELGYDGLVAPPTFVTILGKLVQADFMRKVDTGYDTMQIVQVDQRFVFLKPVVAGDVLHARMEIHSVTERFGADIVVTKNTCTNDAGEVVLEVYTPVLGREGEEA